MTKIRVEKSLIIGTKETGIGHQKSKSGTRANGNLKDPKDHQTHRLAYYKMRLFINRLLKCFVKGLTYE